MLTSTQPLPNSSVLVQERRLTDRNTHLLQQNQILVGSLALISSIGLIACAIIWNCSDQCDSKSYKLAIPIGAISFTLWALCCITCIFLNKFRIDRIEENSILTMN